MDKEFINFKQKITSIAKLKALTWIFIFPFKLCLDFVRRKIFKKLRFKFIFPSKFEFYQDSKIKNLSFLSSHNYLPDSHYNFLNSFNTQPNWKQLFIDEQDLHILHRFKDFPFAAGDKSNFGLVANLVKDWKDKNQEGTLPGWHSYTLCERLVSFCWTLNFISGKAVTRECELEQLLAETSVVHAYFLRNNFEFHLGHHNHLINNARALLTTATLLCDLPEAADWKKYAIKVFKEEWPYQILPDGVHAEQSVTYHFLLTRTLWEMKYLMEQCGEQFPFDDDLNRMIHYAWIITRPDGTIPFLGHLTPDWHWKELIGLLPVWGEDVVPLSHLGRLYKEPVIKNRISEKSYPKVILFPSAGQAILRTENIHAVLSCDPRCTVAVHGDQNYLGFDLWYSGTYLIRDAGIASYNLDAKRAWYESWQGQSTFSIDDFDPMVSNWRKRQLPKGYHQANSTLKCDQEKHLLKASHTGYCRLPDPVVAERQISIKEVNGLCIEDILRCKGQHVYSAKFHFGHNMVKHLSDRSIQINDLANGNSFELHWSIDLELNLEENNFAVAYGEESFGITGSFKYTFTGDTKIEYLLKSV